MSARHEQFTQPLPASIEMEKGVLSCALQAPEWALAKAQSILKPSDFHVPAHGIFFEMMTELAREGRLDLLTLQQLIIDRNLSASVGGPAAAVELYTFAPSPAQVSDYATQVRDKALLRKVVAAANDALADAQAFGDDAGLVLSNFESRVLSLREARNSNELSMTGKAALFATIDSIENQMTRQEPDGVPWGLERLDSKTGGICPGLTIIGAETSGGKSVLAAMAAIALLRAGKRVDFYSLEMPADMCVRRFLACIGNLPFGRLRNPVPAFTKAEHIHFMRAVEEFGSFADRLWICADGGKTANDILTETRRKHGGGFPVDAVICDYIQRLSPNDPRATAEQQITDASRCLKRLADALTIPVITPVQLNDAGLVRGSRMLGMDADLYVKIIHKKGDDDAPAPADSEGRRDCAFWIEKNRNGERWFGIPAKLDGGRMRFTER